MRALRRVVRSGLVVTAVRRGVGWVGGSSGVAAGVVVGGGGVGRCSVPVLASGGRAGDVRGVKVGRDSAGDPRPVVAGVAGLVGSGVPWTEGSPCVVSTCWKAARRYA